MDKVPSPVYIAIVNLFNNIVITIGMLRLNNFLPFVVYTYSSPSIVERIVCGVFKFTICSDG